MSIKKGLIYLSVFLFMAALACKSVVAPAEPVGVWEKSPDHKVLGTLEIKSDSLFFFKASSEGHTDSQGRYSLTEDEITFEDDTCSIPGTYEYSFDDKQLSMAVISDNCEPRANTLSGTWNKKD